MEDEPFKELLDYFEYSWEGYRKVRKGVKKRISRHMREHGCRDMEAYIRLMKRDESVHGESRRRMTVPISRFFRDRQIWEALETEVLPELMEEARGPVRVWSAGCAAGEEAYTFRFVWERVSRSREQAPELRITATDINPETVERAKKGIYPLGSLREATFEERCACFEKIAGKQLYRVRDHLREPITWMVRDLFSDPPGKRFHILLLRNSLLTYYREDFRRYGFRKASESLLSGGWLVVGAHERLPEDATGFERAGFEPHFYRKFPVSLPQTDTRFRPPSLAR